MKAIEQLRRKIESIGGSLDEFDNFVCLDAPSGYVWNANGEPAFSIQFRNNVGQTWLSKALAAESANLKMGLSKVTDAARLAEIQHLHDDDNWMAPEDAPSKIDWPE